MKFLEINLLALIHVKVPVEGEIKHAELCESLLSQGFRLSHCRRLWIDADDRSWTGETTVASHRMSTGSRMSSARQKQNVIHQNVVSHLCCPRCTKNSPISSCTTFPPSPANLWMHLNLLLGSMFTRLRRLHFKKTLHLLHCDLSTVFRIFDFLR